MLTWNTCQGTRDNEFPITLKEEVAGKKTALMTLVQIIRNQRNSVYYIRLLLVKFSVVRKAWPWFLQFLWLLHKITLTDKSRYFYPGSAHCNALDRIGLLIVMQWVNTSQISTQLSFEVLIQYIVAYNQKAWHTKSLWMVKSPTSTNMAFDLAILRSLDVQSMVVVSS